MNDKITRLRKFARTNWKYEGWQDDLNAVLDGLDAIGAGGVSGHRITQGYQEQHHRDSAELRRVCAQRDALKLERDRLRSTLQEAIDCVEGNFFASQAPNVADDVTASVIRSCRAALAQEQGGRDATSY